MVVLAAHLDIRRETSALGCETSAMNLKTHVAEYGHSKYDWYFPFYDDVLKGVQVERLLEIGCSVRSLKMWARCFPQAEIVGLDLTPRGPTNTDDLTTAGVNFVLGDQTDVKLLESLGAFDVVVDDGGHLMSQQIISWTKLFPRMNSGGRYFIEDLHTSYDPGYLDMTPTTVDFIKKLFDDLHSRYISPHQEQRWPIAEIRLADSIVAIKRQ